MSADVMVPNSQAFHRDPFLLSPFRGPVVFVHVSWPPSRLSTCLPTPTFRLNQEREKREKETEGSRDISHDPASLNEYLSQKTPELGHSLLQRERFVCSR